MVHSSTYIISSAGACMHQREGTLATAEQCQRYAHVQHVAVQCEIFIRGCSIRIVTIPSTILPQTNFVRTCMQLILRVHCLPSGHGYLSLVNAKLGENKIERRIHSTKSALWCTEMHSSQPSTPLPKSPSTSGGKQRTHKVRGRKLVRVVVAASSS